MPGRKRSGPWGVAACAAAAALLVLGVRAWRAAGPSLPSVAVVQVSEVSNALLSAPASEPFPEVPASFPPEDAYPGGSLRLPGGIPVGPRPLVVLHRLQHLDRVVYRRLHSSGWGRVELDLARPVEVAGLGVRGGRPQPEQNVLDDAGRLIRGVLRLERLAPAGLQVGLGRETVRLVPGERWGQAWIRSPGSVPRPVEQSPEGREAARQALDAGAVLTVLRVEYLGDWPRSRIEEAGEGP